MTRPQIKSIPRKPLRFMRKAMAYETKRRCIVKYEENEDLTAAISAVSGAQVPSKLRAMKKQVRKGLANKDYIFKQCASGRGALFRHRPRGVATVLTPTSELQIVAWVNSLRRDEIHVSLSMLIANLLRWLPSCQSRAKSFGLRTPGRRSSCVAIVYPSEHARDKAKALQTMLERQHVRLLQRSDKLLSRTV